MSVPDQSFKSLIDKHYGNAGEVLQKSTLICLALVLLTSCYAETKQTKLQYMPDMADTPSVKAQEDYLDPPDHSVSSDAILYPTDPAVAEAEFTNPYPSSSTNLQDGEKLYKIYCSVCHGQDGKGGGTLTDAYPKAAVPDITRAELKERKDGFYFMKITKGGPMMPSYGHATTSEERWKIVNHVRKLQGQ